MNLFLPKVDAQKGTIEGEDISGLIEQYGSPLLVMCERIVKNKYFLLQKALDKYYPNSSIAYSVKTNFLPGILDVFKQIGALAEVVSGFEYWLVKKRGVPDNRIIFNGPDKKTSDIEDAIDGGVMLNIDNYYELERIGILSEKIGKPTNIGIRVNASINDLTWSRFGFKIENGDAWRVAEDISKRFRKLKIVGLHVHMSTNLHDTSHYVLAAEKLSIFAIAIQNEFKLHIEYLDFGGGFAVSGSQWNNNSAWKAPEASEYINDIAKVLHKNFPKNKPKLIIEPGRFLIDEAGVFLATVKNVKQMNEFPPASLSSIDAPVKYINAQYNISNKCQLVNIDSSITSVLKHTFISRRLVECMPKNIPLKPAETKHFVTYIAGNSCLGYDFLAGNMLMPELVPEDRLIFYNTGAYSIVRAEQFIHPRPAIILLEEKGSTRCLRRKETFEDMVSLDNNWD